MDDQFCYVIYWFDEDDDIDQVMMDSVWERNEDAVNRMKEIKTGLLEKGDRVDWNFNERFPYAEDTSIKWLVGEHEYDYKRGVFCKRIFLNPKRLLGNEEQKD